MLASILLVLLLSGCQPKHHELSRPQLSTGDLERLHESCEIDQGSSSVSVSYKSLDAIENYEELEELLSFRLQNLDEESFHHWINSLSESAIGQKYLEKWILHWISQHPDSAWNYAQFKSFQGSLPPVKLILKIFALERSDILLRKLENMGESNLRTRAFNQTLGSIASFDISAALQWSKKSQFQASGSEMKLIFEKAYESRPQEFVQFAYEQLANASFDEYTQIYLLQEWSRKEPSEAMNWAIALPDPYVQNRAIGIAGKALVHQNPFRAANLWPTLPDCEIKQGLRGDIIDALQTLDPQFAQEWSKQKN